MVAKARLVEAIVRTDEKSWRPLLTDRLYAPPPKAHTPTIIGRGPTPQASVAERHWCAPACNGGKHVSKFQYYLDQANRCELLAALAQSHVEKQAWQHAHRCWEFLIKQQEREDKRDVERTRLADQRVKWRSLRRAKKTISGAWCIRDVRRAMCPCGWYVLIGAAGKLI
jgi:hypothetical protein